MRKIVSLVLLLSGLGLLVYPALSSRWNSTAQRRALLRYQAAAARLGAEGCSRLLEEAQARNDPSMLAPEDSGIIGCVAIPALQTVLPIYAGTQESNLRHGAGLLEGTSLPLGGIGQHTVLSAHRGLPEARLFRDLDRLKAGDTFTVTVLDRTLTYRVDQILTTLPEDTAPLLPQEGLDLCTLLTCTPYGINSHRLLVRGRRIFL